MKTKATYTTANEPNKFFLFVGNEMTECEEIEKREKAIKVKRTPVAFDGSLVENKVKFNRFYVKFSLNVFHSFVRKKLHSFRR